MRTEENSTQISSRQKAAMVIIALGAERASKIYKYLNDSELEELTYEVARISQIDSEQTEPVLDDFYKLCVTQKVITDGGLSYAKAVLEKAFGLQVATSLLERIDQSMYARPFNFMRESDNKNLFTMIRNERPQTIALILSYARSDQAAEIISELPPNKRIAVVKNIANMDRASPAAIKTVENVLQTHFSSSVALDFTQIGGVDFIADVMNNMDRANEKFIFDELSKQDEKLVDNIHKRMFVFEDIVLLDNSAIQKFVNIVEQNDLVYALKGANQEVSTVIFNNMSARKAESIKEDLEVLFNVRVRDVEEAQQRIVAVIRRLDEEGELIINKGGKDEFIA
jgi:flagellar motor switch protein FliG